MQRPINKYHIGEIMKYLLLILFIFSTFIFSQEIAYTSFEEPTIFSSEYTDTSDAALDHPLINNENQPVLNYISTGEELGFTSYYYNTRNGDGLTDGDYVGVTNYTGNFSSGGYSDGSNGFEMSDVDGYMVTMLDTVDISAYNSVLVSVDYFVNEEGYESDDVIRIWLVVDDSIEIDMLNTMGNDIDDLNIEEVWNTVSQKISGYHKLNVKLGLDCNAAFEAVFFDNIRIYDGGAFNLPPTVEAYTTSEMPPMSDSTFIVTYKVYDIDGAIANAILHYSINVSDTVDIDMIPLGYDSLYVAEISGTAYADEDEVVFWVSATDDSGSVTISDTRGFFAGTTQIVNYKFWRNNSELLYEGFYVRTRGVATVADSIFSESSMNFYIQDEYPSAVNIYAEGGGAVNIIPGHQYTVKGAIAQYGGIVEVTPDNPESDVIDEGEAEMPEPLSLDIASLLSYGGELESLLIKIVSVDTVASGDDASWPLAGAKSNANIIITDDGGISQIMLHLDKDTDIPGTTEPSWPQNITGIFSQYDYSAPYTEGYQIIPRSIEDFETATAIKDLKSLIPAELILYPAYPNPFNPAATIPFNIPLDMAGEQVKKLSIYNTLGQKVKQYTLSNIKAGLNTVKWDGRSDEGNQMSSGLYFAVLQVSNLRKSTKLLLLK